MAYNLRTLGVFCHADQMPNIWGYLYSDSVHARKMQQQSIFDYVAQTPVLSGGEPLWGRNGARLCMTMRPKDHLILSSLAIAWPHQTVRLAVDWLATWDRQGIHVHLLEGVAGFDGGIDLSSEQGGVLLAGMRTAVEQSSRSRSASRLRAIKRLQAEGRPTGRPRIGFRFVGRGSTRRVEPDPVEQELAAMIFERIEAGESFHQVSMSLRDSGLHRTSRRKWSRNAVKSAYELEWSRRNPAPEVAR